MALRGMLRKSLRPVYRDNLRLRTMLKQADAAVDAAKHAAAAVFPDLIRPDPRNLFISLTANCNLRCKGCHYGRDFMPGHQLEWPIVRDLIDDAKALGFERVRLYGGEPLLHKELPRIVSHIAARGLGMWLTTNGVLLERKADALVEAGLREISLGFYGVGDAYDAYVQRRERFGQLEAGVAYVRKRYGMGIAMHLDWLLMRPTCSLESLGAMWDFAQRYETPIYVNLIHYSLPYFVQGRDNELQFGPEDRPAIEAVVERLLQYKKDRPDLILNSAPGLRSIPDWLIKGPAMRVPCTEYQLIWVGPDGTVQMCYVTFELGNLHERRLSELLFTERHRQAAKDAFALNCPNCHCSYDNRVLRHAPARRRYA